MKTSKEQGSALLITIFFITIITLVSVGFMSTARVERASSRSHLERMRATDFARTGIEQSIGTLRKETGYRFLVNVTDPSTGVVEKRYYYRNYITQPGALIVPDAPSATVADSSSQALMKQVKPLSSGLPNSTLTHANPVYNPPNLNVALFSAPAGKQTYLITDRLDAKKNPVEMKLKWVYIRQNRHNKPQSPAEWTEEAVTLGASEEPVLDAKNPIVGRYAYWTDDESTKINYNLAWRRALTNNSRFSHPSRISLKALSRSDNDADAITDGLADNLHNWTFQKRFFNSFADACEISKDASNAGLSDFLNFNKFELTHYNHDPDTTFFGEDRILLTTNRDLVPKTIDPVTKQLKYTRKFLDIMRDDRAAASLDPGNLDHIAGNQPDWTANTSGGTLVPGGNKFNTAVKNVVRYISEQNWPLSPNQSFDTKYNAGKATTNTIAKAARLGQLAVNIIDYVRSKESSQEFVVPLRFYYNGAEYSMGPSAYGADNSLQGIARAPYFTEMGMSISAIPEVKPTFSANGVAAGNKTLYKCVMRFELTLPSRYDLPNGVDMSPSHSPVLPANTYAYFLRPYNLSVGGAGTTYYWESNAAPTSGKICLVDQGTYAVPITDVDIEGSALKGTRIKPGEPMVIRKVFWREKRWEDQHSPGTGGKSGLRVALHYAYASPSTGCMIGDLNRWPRINICPQAGETIPYEMSNPASATGTPETMISIETNDPRLNSAVEDWRLNRLNRNSFGGRNDNSTIGQAGPTGALSTPQSDTDADNKLTDYGSFMPAPKGKYPGTSNGPQVDKGEDNGVVTSIGEMGYINTGADAIDGGVPFRTIRLQPNLYADNKVLPDWAFMDLFGVPSGGATIDKEPPALYTPHSTSVGGRINVNSHVEPYPDMTRDRGLAAGLIGAKALGGDDTRARKIAKNIYDRTLADGTGGSGTLPSKGKAYGYAAAYDTPGEICEIKGLADGGEQSEDVVREVASLFTARGGVFGIYTVGQAIVQTPSGKLVVTGEQRQHAVVERYVDNHATPDTTDDDVHFRTVYFENLNP